MKKTGLLNQDISEVIAGMGHMDMLVVADAGLPIPPGVRRIDLAVTKGIPGFLETVQAITTELQVERIIIATEMAQVSPHIRKALCSIFAGAKVEEVSYARLKELSRGAVAIIRTGEFTPYANVIMVAGVVF